MGVKILWNPYLINYKIKRLMIRFSRQFVSRWLVFGIDLMIISIAFFSSYILRFNFEFQLIDRERLLHDMVLASVVQVAFFFLFKSFYGVIRHTSMADAIKIFKAVSASAVLMIALSILSRNEILPDLFYIHPSILIIYYHISIFSLIISRMVFKAFYHYILGITKGDRKNVMIFGAGELGMITKNTILGKGYRVLGFIDDNPAKIGKVIEGVEVFPMNDNLGELLSKKNIEEIIIAVQNVSTQAKREIIDRCLEYNVRIKDVPTVDRWINGELSISQIKSVNIEDLLGRECIELDNPQLELELKGKCILITGAAGSIGREIVNQCLHYQPSRLIMVDQSETGLYEAEIEIINEFGKQARVLEVLVADITNKKRMEMIFSKFRPEIVFHAAAYKHVPMMENNPFEAVHTNVNGTRTLADLSVQHRVKKFVMVSTDKAVNPTNIMGATKRIAEIYVQSLDAYLKKIEADSTRFITTRFGNVLGSNGSVIPLFKKQIAAGGPITVTHPEITRYFMTISEACSLVLEAGTMGQGGEIFVFDMGQSVKIVDLAKKMIALSGLKENRDIEIVYTGLRDGEKLYEELLTSTENTIPTYHPKIMIGKVREFAHKEVKPQIEQLIEKSQGVDDMDLVSAMKRIVPEYISHASRYEALDEKLEVKV